MIIEVVKLTGAINIRAHPLMAARTFVDLATTVITPISLSPLPPPPHLLIFKSLRPGVCSATRINYLGQVTEFPLVQESLAQKMDAVIN